MEIGSSPKKQCTLPQFKVMIIFDPPINKNFFKHEVCMKENYATIDEYIASFPEHVREIMVQVQKTILTNAPDAAESISWGMPAFKTHGKPLVYFAGHKNHLGFYGTPTIHAAFAKELSPYKQGKGSVQFPYNQPVPYELIGKIVMFRINENFKKHQLKKIRG
jgi:uncharacterized protein YdhG (YjbR/CyaY superfamily)